MVPILLENRKGVHMLKKMAPFILLFALYITPSFGQNINFEHNGSFIQKEALLEWKKNLEYQFSSIEVVGRAKTEKEEKESQKIRKILFHLKKILNILGK